VHPEFADLIPGYTLHERLGKGGMGTVYKARQKSMDRWVAIKILKPELAKNNPGYIQRFLSEARTAGRLRHDNLVAGLDCGESRGHHFLVMEYVEGRSLDVVLKERGSFPEPEALAVGRQVAEALQHAWDQGIIHRDIKPQNLMVTPSGSVKVCDLGLARSADDDVHLTLTGHVHCSATYASPEQVRGRKDLDTRSDLYSLGVVLYHLLTGAPPFTGEASGDLFVKHATEKPVSPVQRNPKISPATNRLVLSLLEKDREKRPATPAELSARIREILDGGSKVAPAMARRPREPRPAPAKGSYAGWVVGLAIGAVLVGTLALVSLLGRNPPPAAPASDRHEISPRADVPKIVEKKTETPKDPESRFRQHLARTDRGIQEGDWEGARAELEKALRIFPEDPRATERKRRIEWGELEARFAEIVEGARKLALEKKWSEALAAIQEALRMRPEDAGALELKKRFEISERDALYAEAIASGETHLRSREYREAIAAFERALTLRPGDSTAKEALARTRAAGIADPTLFEETRRTIAHQDIVMSIDLHPKENLMVTGGMDKVIKLWDLARGTEIRSMIGHTATLNRVLFTRDGTRVLSCSNDGSIRFWETSSGKEIDKLEWRLGQDKLIDTYCIALTPNGRVLAVGGKSAEIRRYDMISRTFLPSLIGHADSVVCLEFDPEGEVLVSGSFDGNLKTWDTATGIDRHTIQAHQGRLSALTLSPDGKTVATGGFDKTIRLWRTADGQLLHTLVGSEANLYALRFSPDGRYLLSGSANNPILIWNVVQGRRVHQLSGHVALVHALAFLPDGKQLISGSGDKTVRYWKARP